MIAMRQIALLATETTTAATDDDTDVERDLFGNPIAARHGAAPKYRPAKPVQQSLDLAPGTFALTTR